MIYYFSGTGNSAYVARELGMILHEECRFMKKESSEEPIGDSLGFVFPVYSWGVPPNVADFILSLTAGFRNKVSVEQLPVWVVMTCGDEVAKAPEMIISIFKKVGIRPESVWSIIMPNNYVILPGFDVDSKEVEKRKLSEAPSRIKEIANGILTHSSTVDVTRGKMPWLKTKIVYPLFKKWGIFPKKWHSTEACVGCGICVKNCPVNNMTMNTQNRPEWGSACCSCLACYHSCPRHAVAYGKETQKKGQYFFPGDIKP